jgi:alginate O-acetyltransferase complex protein AlgI
VLFLVLISFVIFNHADYSAVAVLGEMFGLKGLSALNADTVYYLRSFAPLFIAAFIGATPVVKNLATKVGQTKIGAVLEILLMAALLILCTAYLVDGSFSPFLYFRF